MQPIEFRDLSGKGGSDKRFQTHIMLELSPGPWVVSSISLLVILSIEIISILIKWFVQTFQGVNLLRGVHLWVWDMLASLLLLKHYLLK